MADVEVLVDIVHGDLGIEIQQAAIAHLRAGHRHPRVGALVHHAAQALEIGLVGRRQEQQEIAFAQIHLGIAAEPRADAPRDARTQLRQAALVERLLLARHRELHRVVVAARASAPGGAGLRQRPMALHQPGAPLLAQFGRIGRRNRRQPIRPQPRRQQRRLVVELDHGERRIVLQAQRLDQPPRVVFLHRDQARVVHMDRRGQRRHVDAAVQRRQAVHARAEAIAHVQVQVDVDALARQRLDQAPQPRHRRRAEGRKRPRGQDADRRVRIIRRQRIQMMQTHRVEAQPAQLPRQRGGHDGIREVGAERQVHAEEPHPRVIARARLAVGADTMEMPVAHDNARSRVQRPVERRHIRRARQRRRIHLEAEPARGRGRRGAHHPHQRQNQHGAPAHHASRSRRMA